MRVTAVVLAEGAASGPPRRATLSREQEEELREVFLEPETATMSAS